VAVAEDLVVTGTKTAVEAVLAQIAELGLTGAVAGQDSRTLAAGQTAVEIWVAAGSAEQAAAETWAAATAVLVFWAQQTL